MAVSPACVHSFVDISPSPQPSPYFPLNAGNKGEGVPLLLSFLRTRESSVLSFSSVHNDNNPGSVLDILNRGSRSGMTERVGDDGLMRGVSPSTIRPLALFPGPSHVVNDRPDPEFVTERPKAADLADGHSGQVRMLAKFLALVNI